MLDKQRSKQALRGYVIGSICCAVFSSVYESYSHGVYSPFMMGLCLVPLLLGVLPALVFWKKSFVFSPLEWNLWHFGVATLMVGCCLRGIFDIYGTAVSLVNVYWLGGIGMLMVFVTLTIRGHTRGATA
jgi:glucan phosphoethanolaminetransferase (alkaline phosphatase superfamily)